ncbi:MAG: hypothetical protein A07HN63_00475 [uncultured archaeon A07HN63]|nr:MAG: hypothetical protein A07HN63_00475 [uncultured archaeon A07HN63]
MWLQRVDDLVDIYLRMEVLGGDAVDAEQFVDDIPSGGL